MTEGRGEPILVVGVGASAGGLEAFKALMEALPDASGMAYVLVQHLDPNHESMLADLLAAHTGMPIEEAAHGRTLAPDTVYVIPPDTALGIDDGRIVLSEPEVRQGARLTIDYLFRSLAEEYGPRAVGIVLSGAGSDGTLGLRAIKGVGGLTVAQQPDTATQPSMPRSAIDSGAAECVLAIEEMPSALERFAKLPPPTRVEPGDEQEDRETDHFDDATLGRLTDILGEQEGFELGIYKRSTVERRVIRRMALAGHREPETYLDQLEEDTAERRSLRRDMLIGVTDFFRDPEAYEALRELVIDPLVAEAESGTVLRAWVAGCATGEEAYSIGMELLDAVAHSPRRLQVQIFATDPAEEALSIARRAVYPASIVEHVSPERLERYFKRLDGRGFEVRPLLRDVVSFAVHDLARDAPFSRMHLASCRNVLIYLNREAQEEALKRLHFALVPGGSLFLGSSESTTPQRNLFSTLSKSRRVYRKVGSSPILDLAGARIEARDRRRGAEQASGGRERAGAGGRRKSDDLARRAVLAAWAPPTIVVSGEGEVVFIHGEVGPYLRFPQGNDLRLNLASLLRPELATRARGALYRCRRNGEREVVTAPSVGDPGRPVRITAHPASGLGDDAVVLSFDTFEAAVSSDGEPEGGRGDQTLVDQLERELMATREDLRNTVEELETSNEELRSSNEEAMSMNEELQSTNEELEATSEELRSLNEELSTVNAELREKVQELEQTNDDLANFFASTEIATVFLDERLCVKRFTPAAGELLDIDHADVGRYIGDLAHPLLRHDLVDEARPVLARFRSVAREITEGEQVWDRRVLPYRTEDRRVAGVVVTWLEITELRHITEALRRNEERWKLALDATGAGAWELDLEDQRAWRSPRHDEIFGYARPLPSWSYETLLEHVVAEDRERVERELRALLREPSDWRSAFRIRGGDGVQRWIRLTARPYDVAGERGKLSGVVEDVTAEKRSEEALLAARAAARDRAELFRAVIDASPFPKIIHAEDGRILMMNRAWETLSGYRHDEVPTLAAWTRRAYGANAPEEHAPPLGEGRERMTPLGERRITTAAGASRVWELYSGPLGEDEQGEPLFLSTAVDVTEKKQQEEALVRADRAKDEFLAVLGHELRNPLAPLRSGVALLGRAEEDTALLERVRPIMERQLSHLVHLVDDLLDVSRVSRGKIELRYELHDVRVAVGAAVEQVRELIDERDQKLEVSLDDAPIWVTGDVERLTQAMANLLDNASKYSPTGGTISLRGEGTAEGVTIEVRDYGYGFPPERMEQLFEPFTQVPEHRTATGGGGLGIGLALTRKLVELHGGEIEAVSEGTGRGATFRIRLPAGEPVSVPAERPPPVSGEALRILVVDDNRDAAESLRMLLEAHGHEVHAEYEGPRAIEAYDRIVPDVVLLDLGLPGHDGVEVARRLRERSPGHDVRLIAVTGWGQREDKARTREAGFDAHLTKPVASEELLRTLHGVENAR